MIGRIAFKLSRFDLHIKYKEQILAFYKSIINHKDEENKLNENKLNGVYNLPCFH